MTPEQLRHAKSMARKIKSYASSIVSNMSVIENMKLQDTTNLPLSNMTNRFTHDTGYGVQDYINAIEDVIKDMLGDLETQ